MTGQIKTIGLLAAAPTHIGATTAISGDLDHAHWAAPLNGLPETAPYTYRGSDFTEPGDLPARPAPAARPRKPPARLSPAARLDMLEAVDGPGPEWYRELRQP